MKFLLGGVMLSCLLIFTSCEGFDFNDLMNPDQDENVDDGTDDGEEGDTPVVPGGNAALLSPDEQKTKLDEVGVKILEKCPANDMEDFFEFYDAFIKEYIDREVEYDFDALFSFGEGVVKDAYDENSNNWFDASKMQYTREDVMDLVVIMSDHNADFMFGPDSVSRDRTSTFAGVRADIPLRGKNYEARIVASGKTTTAYYNYLDNYQWSSEGGYYDRDKDEWVEVNGTVTMVYKDDFEITVNVPEQIEIGLYEDGAPMATVVVDAVQSFTAAGLNPSLDNFNYDITVFFNNGYELYVKDVAYDGVKGEAGGGISIIKDGMPLVSAAATGKASVENTIGSWESSDGSKDEYTSVKVNYAKDIQLLADIIGEVQIKGTCSNAKEFSESMDAFYEALDYWDGNGYRLPDEQAALRHLNNLNAKIDLGVYYDLDYTTKQAHVEFELDKQRCDWDINGDGVQNSDDIDYDLIPVIVFNDKSRYTIEDYFTEEAFQNLLDRVDGFADEYDKLFGKYFEKEDLPMEGEVVGPTPELPGTEVEGIR